MPSRDPKTGKELSGAQKRQRKVALDAEIEQSRDEDRGEWARAFKRAGKPNLDDPGTDLDYTRKLQLIVLEQMATEPFPTPAQRETWKRIREMSAVVGMTSNRAQLESKVRKLQGALAARRDTAAGALRMEPGAKIKKPKTARGMSPPGPRAIPPDAVVEPPPPSFDDEPEEPPKE
jgi:hypothetical protein